MVIDNSNDDSAEQQRPVFDREHHDLVEKILTEELSRLVMAIFPGAVPEVVKSDVSTFIQGDGIGNYHGGLGEYIVRGIAMNHKEFKDLTFQELTEILSLLPPRAPKELGVKLYRDDEDKLKMQFIGEIDVVATAGKRQE